METNDPPPKKSKKSTAAEVQKRVDEIFRLKLDGAQFHDIFQYASENQWDVTERMVREYMRRAEELMKERAARKRSVLKAEHLAMRRALFARSVSSADFRTALAVLDSEAKIVGLFEDQKELKRMAAEVLARIANLEKRNADTPNDFPGSGEPGRSDREEAAPESGAQAPPV